MYRNSKHSREGGLSLIEMLVTVAITVVLLSAILGVLLSTMRTVARGHNIQKGYDLARGTYEVIEQDLSNAFASRDTGDHYKFFGTPIGMMFVGQARGVVSRKAEGLARVSYVIHYNSRASTVNAVEMQGRDVDPNTGLVDDAFAPVQAYSLVRYVESGVSDLDSYNFGGATWLQMVQSTEFPNARAVFAEEFARAIDQPTFNIVAYFQNQIANPNGGSGVTKDQARLIEAKKRELYLRMLAGDPQLPNAFNEIQLDANGAPVLDGNGNVQIIPGFLRDASGATVNWLDYVVAENVAFTPKVDEGIGIFTAPAMPQLAAISGVSEAAHAAAPWGVWPAFFVYGTRENFQNMSDALVLGATSGAMPRPVELISPYWGATYNAYQHLYPGAGTDVRRLAVEEVMAKHGYAPYAAQRGSPLVPRLPELVGVRMGYQLPSPFIGVQEFDQTFAQMIDIPTAYSRKKLAAPI